MNKENNEALLLKEKIESIYLKKIKNTKITEKQFSILLEEVLLETQLLLSKTIDKSDMENDVLKKLEIICADRKNKWYDAEMKNSKSGFHENIKNAEYSFNSPDFEIKNYKNIDEYIQDIKAHLKKWKSDKNQELSDFRYIKNKRIDAQINAFKMDIKIYIIKQVVEQAKILNIEGIYTERINPLVTVPTDSKNRIKMEQKSDSVYEYNYNKNNTDIAYRFYDDKQESIYQQAGKAMSRAIKTLNDIDIQIFEYILQVRKSNFFKDGKVLFSIYDACNTIFGYYNDIVCQNLIASTFKLRGLRVYNKSEDNSPLSDASLLEGVFVDDKKKKEPKSEDLKRNILVIVGTVFREEILNGNLIRIYSDTYNKYKKDADVRKFLYYLQKERVVRYYNNKDKNLIDNSYLFEEKPYTEFASLVLIERTRIDKAKKRIYNALRKIAEDGVILKSVSLIGDFFKLQYAPLTDKEIEDLELNNIHIPILEER